MRKQLTHISALGIIALAAFLAARHATAAEAKPNLILILVDDQGYYDLGCYGGTEFDTPRIDRMAREGIRFTDYYAAAPICSPSRAGLLTGCYPRRVGLATWVLRADSPKGIHPDETHTGRTASPGRLRHRLHRQVAPRLPPTVPAAQPGFRSLLRIVA